MPGIMAISAIIRKDLEDAFRSRTLLLVLLGPALLSVLFARAFTDGDFRQPEVALHDPGRSGLGRALHAAEIFRLREVAEREEGWRLVRDGRVAAALSIPPGFDEELLRGAFPRLDLAVDETARAQVEFVRQGLRAVLREQAGQEIPADIRVEKVREASGGVRLAMLPIWVVFTCLAGLMIASSSLVEEVESRSLLAVLATPARFADVLVGKIVTGSVLAFGASALILVLNQGWKGNLLTLGLLLAAGSLAFAALGTVVALFSRGQAAANAGASLLYLVLFVPVALADLSTVMRAVSGWTPAWYLYDGVNRALLSRAGPAEVGFHLAVLVAGTLLLGGVGTWRLRRQIV